MSKATEQFEIQTRLAVGDAGLVYRAVDKAGRTVALKLLLTEHQVAHPLDVEALLRDAPQLQTITGVNIVQLLDAFPDEDGTVLVYECAEGHRGLDVPAKCPISAAHAVDVAAQLLSALRSGERQRYPHGDLKPSDTVIIDLPEGRPLVMVLDWGLANYRRELSPESFAYTAPERLAGASPSHTADLFSAGATLHYLFTGKRLLPCATREEFAAAWASLDVNALAAMRPDLSKELVSWIARLISPDPSARPESAVKALEELAALAPPLPPAVPENIRPRPARIPQAPQSGVAAPVSAVRAAPRSSIVQPQSAPKVSDGNANVSPDVIAAAKAEVARLEKKRKKLTAICSVLALVACISFGGIVVWKKQREKAERDQLANVGESPLKKQPVTESPKPVAAAAPKEPAPKLAGAKPGGPKTAAKKPAAAGVEFPVHDSFAYPVGAKLAGQNGGVGWMGPWSGDGAVIDAESLVVPGLPASGAKLLFARSATDVRLARVVSPKANLLGPKGGTFFFAISVQLSDDPFSIESEFQFNPLDGTAPTGKPMRVIIRDQGKGFEVVLFNINNRLPKDIATSPNAGAVLNIVQRIVVSPLPDGKSAVASDVWLNPDTTLAEPPTSQISYALTPVILPPDITLLLRKKATPTARVDAVRYSKSWAGLFK